MTRDEQVLQTTIEIKIECTGHQVRALNRMLVEADVNASNYKEMQKASALINEIVDTYDDHFHNDMIRPADWVVEVPDNN